MWWNPIVYVLLYSRMLPESPRWLYTKQRYDEMHEVLNRISHTNSANTHTNSNHGGLPSEKNLQPASLTQTKPAPPSALIAAIDETGINCDHLTDALHSTTFWLRWWLLTSIWLHRGMCFFAWTMIFGLIETWYMTKFNVLHAVFFLNAYKIRFLLISESAWYQGITETMLFYGDLTQPHMY